MPNQKACKNQKTCKPENKCKLHKVKEVLQDTSGSNKFDLQDKLVVHGADQWLTQLAEKDRRLHEKGNPQYILYCICCC